VMRVSDEQLNDLLMRIMQKTSDEGVKRLCEELLKVSHESLDLKKEQNSDKSARKDCRKSRG